MLAVLATILISDGEENGRPNYKKYGNTTLLRFVLDLPYRWVADADTLIRCPSDVEQV